MNRRGFLKLLVVGTTGLAIAPTLFAHRDLNVRICWTKDENQKVALIRQLMENAINTHDRMIEEAIFSGSFSEKAAWEVVL